MCYAKGNSCHFCQKKLLKKVFLCFCFRRHNKSDDEGSEKREKEKKKSKPKEEPTS